MKFGVFYCFRCPKASRQAESDMDQEGKSMKGRFEGKVALVTGGSSGIGRAACLAFSGEGAKVVIADVDAEGGQKTLDKIKESGGEAVFVPTDVSRESEVEAMVQKTLESFGRLDVAFNNAAVAPEKFLIRLADQTEQDYDRIMGINLRGVWLCMKYEIPEMLKQGSGAIVNNSSVVGLRGSTVDTAIYAGSKHGVVGLTKTAALEYGRKGIRVNGVCPGGIATPMYDAAAKCIPGLDKSFPRGVSLARIGTPEEIAKTALFLCSDEASYINGQNIVVDGGMIA